MSEVSDIQTPFREWLDKRGLVYIWQRSDRATSAEKGVPDFVILSGNLALCIECKLEKGAVSTDQKKWHAKLAAIGGKVHIARSLAECVTLTENWLRGLFVGAAIPRVNSAGLHRHGDGVFKRTGDAFTLIRKVSQPGDQMLPPIS